MSRFLVINFCTYCSNFERNPSQSLRKEKVFKKSPVRFLLLISTGFTSNPCLIACFEPPFHLEIILTSAVLIAFKAAILTGKEIQAKNHEFLLDSSRF